MLQKKIKDKYKKLKKLGCVNKQKTWFNLTGLFRRMFVANEIEQNVLK